SVLMSSANGTFTVRPEISAGSNTVAVAVADFDRDGTPDIVAVTEGSNSVALRLNKCLFPELRVEKSHVGSFTQGQTGAEYAIIVYNVGNAPSTGTITVSELLPSGLIATGFAGVTPGWACNIQTLTCTTAGAIPVNGSSPQITLTVNVRSNAASTETNTATL